MGTYQDASRGTAVVVAMTRAVDGPDPAGGGGGGDAGLEGDGCGLGHGAGN